MRLVFSSIAIFIIALTVSRGALADSSCEWAGCPELADGDCSQPRSDNTCGNGAGTCEPAHSGCGLAEINSAGQTIYYCTKPPPYCSDGGGCSMGTDSSHAKRRIALPSMLAIAGVIFLTIDRRRQRR